MEKFSLNIRGRLVVFDRPAVMGILNITPDSFFAGSRVSDVETIALRARQMKEEGADIIDIGACSTRPGSASASLEDELQRLAAAVPAVRQAVGHDMILSVDTFRSEVVRRAIGEWGADIVNDISAGAIDPEIFYAVADMKAPYILMHMRGTPLTMQRHTEYADVTAEVIEELSHPLARLEELGVNDVIIDPGFGFAKTLEQNYTLLRNLQAFGIFGRPLLAGMSRKSMATRLLGISPDEALPATCVLNAFALERGAAILRVHDVAEARRTVDIYSAMNQPCLTSE